MSDVLNYYLQKYGVIENKSEDIKIDTNERARERWNLLRKSMANVSEIVEKNDLKDNWISHGVQFVRRISHVNDIEQAIYITSLDSYFTLDGCSIRIFDSNGRYKNFMAYSDINVAFKRLEYATESGRFVAWTPGTDEMAMLGSNFEVIEKIDSNIVEGIVDELFYNEDKNEIISFQPDKVTLWQFRYANKHLIPRKTIPISCKNKAKTIFTIERTQRKYQRLFLVNECGVVTLDLCQGAIVTEYSMLHERRITALTFFNPKKLLITGCRDGSIKVWSFTENDIKLDMVFVGHTSCVNSLAFFPGGCQATVASCGDDKTLRVWSLELNDEMECIDLEYSSKFIGSDITKSTFFTLGNNFIDIWHQNQVADEVMTLNDPISNMELIEENNRKLLLRCKNNMIFYMESSKSARVITKTVIGNPIYKILSTVHLEERNSLLVLVQENRILQYSTKTHPMLLESSCQYSCDDHLVLLTAYKPVGESDPKSPNKCLVLSGSKSGWLRVHDLDQLENITFQIEAHSESSINCLITDAFNSRLFTSGHDNTIKIWHVYPFAIEPLSKVLSFFCGLLPFQLTSINNYLFTVFQDLEGAQFPIVVYNIKTRGRYDHAPKDDHVETVNSVSACNRMKLFLSCSSGTENIIKIWTRKNVLLRQIEMHFPIHYAVFSSPKADIFTAVGVQVSYIDHTQYLPKIYIKKQVLMHFGGLSQDEVTFIEFDKDLCEKKFDSDERDKMSGIKPVFRYESYIDILTEAEVEEISRVNGIKQKNLDKMRAVEDDIIRIKSGEHEKPINKSGKLQAVASKADIFAFYFSQIFKYNKISLPFEKDDVTRTDTKTAHMDKYIKSDKEGFFPPRETINNTFAPSNIRKGGYIPNSILLQTLWPPNVLEEKADVWKPMLLSSLDLKQQELLKSSLVDNLEEEESQFFDWESDEELDKREPSPEIVNEDSDIVASNILSRFESLIEEKQSSFGRLQDDFTPNPEVTPEESVKIASVSPSQRPMTTKLTKASLKLPAISRIPATMPEIRRVRFSSTSDNISVSEEPPTAPISVGEDMSHSTSSLFLTQVPEQEVSKIEKESVLPSFLTYFQKEHWFAKICPPPHYEKDCLKQLPSPLNPSTFLQHLLNIMKNMTDIEETLHLVNAINYLYSNESIDARLVQKLSTMVENKINELYNLDTESKLSLFKSCLHLLASLEGLPDKTLVIICLTRLFEADNELKTYLKSILTHIGLEDHTDIVEQELLTFKFFSVRTEAERMEDLKKLVVDWIERWYQSMVAFSTECREIISKEIHLIGSSHEKLSKNVTVCLENVKSIFHCQILSPSDLILLYPVEKNPKSILTYINCLNFFRFRKLQRQRKEQVTTSDIIEDSKGPKKTIVTLPKLSPNKQCLVRIGESNADNLQIKSRKDIMNLSTLYQKNAIVDCTQHPSMQPLHQYQVALGGGFVPFLHLHLKHCLVNPFPNTYDLIELENANPKSLSKTYHRPFIPQFSLPPEPF